MFEKYLKYKKKYLALKGGFALSQECYGEPYNIDAETDSEMNEELNDKYFYPRLKKFFEQEKEFYKKNLDIINNYSLDKSNIPNNTDEIIDKFQSEEYIKILEDLFDDYNKDELSVYHVQYTSVIFLSFILELELFMIYYSIVPYNTIQKDDNFDNSIYWTDGMSKPIYNNLLNTDIIILFKNYVCLLEQKYKEFVEDIVKSIILKIYNQISENEIKNIIYKDENYDYRHIKHDWIKRLKEELDKKNIIIDIPSIIITQIEYFSDKYNTNQLGLFDYIYQRIFYVSCITSSMLEFYLLSRLHINYKDLYLRLETKELKKHNIHKTTQESMQIFCSHWSCSCMNQKIRSSYNNNTEFSIENKVEIILSFFFVLYDRYIHYIKLASPKVKPKKPILALMDLITGDRTVFINETIRYTRSINYDKLINFINQRQQLIFKCLFKSKKNFITSININPYNTLKYVDTDYKYISKSDIIEQILESLKSNSIYIYELNDEFKKSNNLVLQALKNNQITYANIKNNDLKQNKDIVLLALEKDQIIYSNINDDLKQNTDILSLALKKNQIPRIPTMTRINDHSIDEIVKKNGLALEFADQKLQKDHYIVLNAIENNGLAFQFADPNLQKDYFIVLSAVRKNGYAIKYAASTYLNDRTVVKDAVENNGLALKFASKDLQNDRTVVKDAVENNGLALKFASKDLQNDRTIVLEAVKNNGLALQFASKDLQNDENIVSSAVENNGLALQFASENLQNKYYIVKDAVDNNGLALQFASKELQNDKEIVGHAIENNGLALKFASKNLQKNDILIDNAIFYNALAVEFIEPSYIITRKIAINAVRENGLALKFLKDLQNDETIVLKAVKNDGLALQFASQKLQNNENILLEAIKKNGLALEFTDDLFKDNKYFVLIAVQNDGLALQHASKDLQNDENIVLNAVKNDGLALKHASKNLQNNKNIVLNAVKNKIFALEFASKSIKNSNYYDII
jgi:hypothetical protein